MRARISPGPFAFGLALGAALFFLGRGSGPVLSDLLFSLGSGLLLAGLVRLLSNLRAFASFAWGVRMLKRLVAGEARSGREETEDYRRCRARAGGYADAPWLLIAAACLMLLSALAARFA